MPRGGRLLIETANVDLDEAYARPRTGVIPGHFVMLAVSDTGIGMDAETQSHLFEPFFTTKEKGKGTGLGLSTVYGIVKQTGGNIWVYSEPGHGTTFKIYLPRVQEEVDLIEPLPALVELPKGVETILLVEDEESVRTLVRNVLLRQGYQVIEARNGDEALTISDSHEAAIHLLISDVVMPGMSGDELVKELVTRRPTTRVLFISGYTDRSVTIQGQLDPETRFLQKPFTPDTLLRKVHEVIHGAPAPGSSARRHR
jgi:CheY-like chemotaxis protein